MAKLNINDLKSKIEAAREAAAAGQAKAHRAKELLAQAQNLENVLAKLQKEHANADAELAATLAEAEALRPVLGEDFLAQAQEAARAQRASWEAEEAALRDKIAQVRAELRELDADPELQAFLALQERERLQAELPARLAALRPGAQAGEGAEELAAIAREAARVGLLDLAAQAQDAAEVAAAVAVDNRRAGLVRWARRRAQKNLVLVVNYDRGQGLALRPRPTRRGGIFFEVVASHGLEEAPEALSQLPAGSRLWRGSRPEVEGLSPKAVSLVKEAAAKGMKGRKVNALLAELTAPAPTAAPKAKAAPAAPRRKKAANRRKKTAGRPAAEVGVVSNSLADILADEVRQKLADAA